ncbi:MAG: hypothetical protein H0U41_04950 [Actinobacteria bacterium]|jgi:hypothetical protein|nr:hypothetical protein [Actinomycetota bacterium]
MSPPRRNQARRDQARRDQPPGRRRRGHKPKPVDLWRTVPQLGEPEPIRPAGDPGALLRSLGDVPLQGQGAVAEHHLAAVVERAAGLATALAAAAGLLAESDESRSI